MPRENMKAIQCGRCEVLIPLLHQFPVNGVQTFEYHCTSCNGKVHLQLAENPQTGEVVAKQVRLTGSPDEFRPNPVRPNTQLQIPVAYTLGGAPSTRHIPAPPVKPPAPAYTLGKGQQRQQIHPSNPMHPDQIRRRMQPIRWE